jgi:hypothetical protein
MRLDGKLKKILAQNTPGMVISSLIKNIGQEKFLLYVANQCLYKSNAEKNKRRKRNWYNLSRLFHRAYDEINLEKSKKVVFKVARRDFYECQKCKKRFKVDPVKEENCIFEVDRGMVIVKCPNCGVTE